MAEFESEHVSHPTSCSALAGAADDETHTVANTAAETANAPRRVVVGASLSFIVSSKSVVPWTVSRADDARCALRARAEDARCAQFRLATAARVGGGGGVVVDDVIIARRILATSLRGTTERTHGLGVREDHGGATVVRDDTNGR